MPNRNRQPLRQRPFKRASGDSRSVSVFQPIDMLNQLKEIAREREVQEGIRVPIRQLYNEAVAALVADIKGGQKIQFATTPAYGTIRRTIWLLPDTMDDLQELRTRLNVLASNFVLTALLRYFSKRGFTFENFPAL